MPFPLGGTPANAAGSQPATPPPPPAGHQGPPPPPPVDNTITLPDMYILTDAGASSPAPIPGQQLASMPDSTLVHHGGQWVTLGQAKQQLLPPPIPAACQGGVAPMQQGRSQYAPGNYGTPHQQQTQGRSPFAGIESAEVGFKRLPYLAGHEQGYQYICRIMEIKYVAGRSSNNVFVEVEILESSYDPNNPISHHANPPGSKASMGIKQNDSFLRNMKELAIALSPPDAQGNWRPDTDVVTEAEMNNLTSDEQPAQGRLIYVTATNTTTTRGNPFTRFNFYACVQNPDNTYRYAQ